MAPMPRRVVSRTTDLDEAVETMRAAFGDVELRPDESGRVDLMLHAVSTPELAATRWSLDGVGGGTVRHGHPEAPMLLTGVRLGGELRMWSRRDDLDCRRPFLYPDSVETRVERPEEATLAVARSAVDAYARAATGIDDATVRFTGTAPVDRGADALWRDTVARAMRNLDALHDGPGDALARATLTDFVITRLLAVFPNSTSGLADGSDRGRSAGLRRAVAHIDDHLHEPLTIADIARAAGLTPRGLQAAFRRELDLTPLGYVRDGRLAAAHAELRRADPGATTVAAVAARWGFADPAYFGRLYRRTYGVPPRHTLEA